LLLRMARSRTSPKTPRGGGRRKHAADDAAGAAGAPVPAAAPVDADSVGNRLG
jgi:hypothetical protein